MEACFAFVSTLQKPAQPVTLHLRNYLNRVETIKRAHSGSGRGQRETKTAKAWEPLLGGMGDRHQGTHRDVLQSRAPRRGGPTGDAHPQQTGLTSTPSMRDDTLGCGRSHHPKLGREELRLTGHCGRRGGPRLGPCHGKWGR